MFVVIFCIQKAGFVKLENSLRVKNTENQNFDPEFNVGQYFQNISE